jgi:hypothetical protein
MAQSTKLLVSHIAIGHLPNAGIMDQNSMKFSSLLLVEIPTRSWPSLSQRFLFQLF